MLVPVKSTALPASTGALAPLQRKKPDCGGANRTERCVAARDERWAPSRATATTGGGRPTTTKPVRHASVRFGAAFITGGSSAGSPVSSGPPGSWFPPWRPMGWLWFPWARRLDPSNGPPVFGRLGPPAVKSAPVVPSRWFDRRTFNPDRPSRAVESALGQHTQPSAHPRPCSSHRSSTPSARTSQRNREVAHESRVRQQRPTEP
jgi:hypothetical protein